MTALILILLYFVTFLLLGWELARVRADLSQARFVVGWERTCRLEAEGRVRELEEELADLLGYEQEVAEADEERGL